MEEILDAVNFEIQNSGFAEKLTAGVVITGGGSMLKNLPQLVKFKTAMDVRIGHPNVHLTGKAKDEINQPMYATSVGLILKGRDYLEETKTYLRFGEKKPEPERVTQKEPGYRQFRDEPVNAAVEVPEDYDPPRSSFTDKLKNFWQGIVDATDEKINDNPEQ
jgi:cell division protein FtsA